MKNTEDNKIIKLYIIGWVLFILAIICIIAFYIINYDYTLYLSNYFVLFCIVFAIIIVLFDNSLKWVIINV